MSFTLSLSLLVCVIGWQTYLTLGEDQNGKGLKVIYVIRHGERAPYKDLAYPGWLLNNDVWPNGEGMLTDRGINDIYIAGLRAGNRYVKLFNLTDKKMLGKMIAIKTSASPRAISTAKAFKFGLVGKIWRENLLNKSRIYQNYSSTVKQSPDLLFNSALLCVNYQIKMMKNIMKRTDVQRYLAVNNATFVKAFRELNITDFTKINLHDYVKVQDPLNCLASHRGLDSLPAFAKVNQTYEKFNQLVNYMYKYAVKDKSELQKAIIGRLFNQIMTKLQTAIDASLNKTTSLKIKQIQLYSAHDHTLGALMTALNISYETQPAPGSALVMELRKNKNSYVINLYKQKDAISELEMVHFIEFDELKIRVKNITSYSPALSCKTVDDYRRMKEELKTLNKRER